MEPPYICACACRGGMGPPLPTQKAPVHAPLLLGGALHRWQTVSAWHATCAAPMQNEVGKGAFQECDQLAAVAGHVKWAGQAAAAADIPRVVAQAFQVSTGCGGLQLQLVNKAGWK